MRTSHVRNPRDDAGLAVLTVMLVGAILAGMGLALAKSSIINLDNAGRDRVGTGALGAAEAGIAGGIGFLRQNGVGQVCDACTAAYNISTPKSLSFERGGAASVTIRAVQPYAPPTYKVGRYLIRSVGTTGSGPGKRTIEQTVEVQPFAFPLGVYTQAKVNLGGSVSVTQESFFSGACVDSRNKLTVFPGASGSVIDPFNGIPAGVHSASYITNANQNVCSTSDVTTLKVSDLNLIHGLGTCNTTYKADQDNSIPDALGSRLGGPFTTDAVGSQCRTYNTDPATGQLYGDYGTKGSGFDLATMKSTYGFVARGLSDDQYALLKAKAKAAGSYFPAGTTPVFPVASTVPGNAGYNPIIYIEGQSLSLTSQLDGYAWQTDVPPCNLKHPSVIIVVEGGNLNLGSSTSFTGNLFVPDGTTSFSGSSVLVGTIFSKDLKFVGGGNVGINECFARNTNGNILSVVKMRFREVDS